jgi:hypothetical protein
MKKYHLFQDTKEVGKMEDETANKKKVEVGEIQVRFRT